MKKNIYKLVSSLLIITASMLPAASAFSEDVSENTEEQIEKISLIDEDEQIIAISEDEDSEQNKDFSEISNSIIIDDNIIEDAEIISSENTLMLPARKVFEALGYNVTWNKETKSVIMDNLPLYITFTIGTDGYTIAKTAPLKLNKAPELINETTYVPVSLLTEILEMDAVTDENSNLIINTNSEDSSEETTEEESSEETSEITTEEESSEEASEETSEEESSEIASEEESSEENSEETSEK